MGVGFGTEVLGAPPAPAAVGQLVAVDPEHAVLDVAVQVREALPLDLRGQAPFHQVRHQHVGHEGAEGLLHAAVGVLDQVGQRRQQQLLQLAHGREHDGGRALGPGRRGDVQRPGRAVHHQGAGNGGGHQGLEDRHPLLFAILQAAAFHPGRHHEGARLVRGEAHGEAVLALVLQPEGAFGGALQAAVLHLEPHAAFEGAPAEVAHQGDGPGGVALGEGAGHREAHLQGLGSGAGGPAHAHLGGRGHGQGRGAPGREVVRQGQIHGGLAIGPHRHEGRPVGRVLEVLADLLVVGLELALGGLLEGAHIPGAAQEVEEAPVGGAAAHHQVAAHRVEEAEGIRVQLRGEGVDGFIHHPHAQVRPGGTALVVLHGNGHPHGPAGFVAVTVGAHLHLEALVHLGHPQGHLHHLAAAVVEDLEHGPGVGLVGLPQGDLHHGGGARHLAQVPLAQALALQGPAQGEVGLRQAHQHLGRIAHAVLLAVRQGLQVGHGRQGRVVRGHVDGPQGFDGAARTVLGFGMQQEEPRLGQREGGRGALALAVHLAGPVLVGPAPAGIGGLLLAPLGEADGAGLDGDGHAAHLVAFEIQHPHGGLEGLARGHQLPVRAQEDHQIALGAAHLGLAAVALAAGVGDPHHQAPQALLRGLQARDRGLALLIQLQGAALLEHGRGTRIRIPPGKAGPHLVEQPFRLGAHHGGTVEVAGLHLEAEGIAHAHLLHLRIHGDLEAGLHELLHLELRLGRAFGALEHHAVEAQAPGVGQLDAGAEGGGLGAQERGLALGHLGVLGIQHPEGHGLQAGRYGVLAFGHGAHDGLDEDLLAGPVEGPLGEGEDPLPWRGGPQAFRGQHRQGVPLAGPDEALLAGARGHGGLALAVEGEGLALPGAHEAAFRPRHGRAVPGAEHGNAQVAAVLFRQQGQVRDQPRHVGHFILQEHLQHVEPGWLRRQQDGGRLAFGAFRDELLHQAQIAAAFQGQGGSGPGIPGGGEGRAQGLALPGHIPQAPGGGAVGGAEGPPPAPQEGFPQHVQGIPGAPGPLPVHLPLGLGEEAVQEGPGLLHAVQAQTQARGHEPRAFQAGGFAGQAGPRRGEGPGKALFQPRRLGSRAAGGQLGRQNAQGQEGAQEQAGGTGAQGGLHGISARSFHR
ncbi:MAG: hypothetical protein BWY56_02114 [Acidobacteria bacterium ADurb.Bin340]|nr:MAG: hypothetical protein BWY56_02114 [Acidobacteria bacterium ADurb.Bin340]